jgi:hypothetical protein
MRKIFPAILAATAAMTIIGAAARADEAAVPNANSGDEASVGIGLICDTPEQAQQYVALRAGGVEFKAAVQKINDEAKSPRACGVAAIAYIPGKMVASQSVGAKLMQVIRINIVAGYNGSGWQQVTGLVQYAIIEAKGMTI